MWNDSESAENVKTDSSLKLNWQWAKRLNGAHLVADTHRNCSWGSVCAQVSAMSVFWVCRKVFSRNKRWSRLMKPKTMELHQMRGQKMAHISIYSKCEITKWQTERVWFYYFIVRCWKRSAPIEPIVFNNHLFSLRFRAFLCVPCKRTRKRQRRRKIRKRSWRRRLDGVWLAMLNQRFFNQVNESRSKSMNSMATERIRL